VRSGQPENPNPKSPARRAFANARAAGGGRDDVVIELNEQALQALRCPRELVIVPGATHLFEEAGALDEVARLATDWFVRCLAPNDDRSPVSNR